MHEIGGCSRKLYLIERGDGSWYQAASAAELVTFRTGCQRTGSAGRCLVVDEPERLLVELRRVASSVPPQCKIIENGEGWLALVLLTGDETPDKSRVGVCV